MKKFKYTAYDSNGIKQSATVQAVCEDSAIDDLVGQGLTPIELKPVSGTGDDELRRPVSTVPLTELELFTSEMALLLKNGMRIDEALMLLQKAFAARKIAPLIYQLNLEVRQGKSLSEVLEAYPKIFSPLYVNLIRLGENSGKFDDAFESLAANLRFQQELKKKMIQAMSYPMVIFLVCFSSLLFIFNFIVPRMQSLFEGAEELPIYTRILLGFSEFVQTWQWALPIVFLGIPLVFSMRNLIPKQSIDSFLLRLPIMKNLIYLLERIRHASSMSLTLSNGVPLERCLELSCKSVKSLPLQVRLRRCSEKLRQGSSLTNSLEPVRIYPDLQMGLIHSGEESASLRSVFSEISDRSRKDFESWVDKLASILEPLMVIIMGAIVGGIVIVMLLSIISVQDISF